MEHLAAKPPEFIWQDAIWRLRNYPTYTSLFKELTDKGFTGMDIQIIEPNSNFYFYSPTLAKLNFNQQPDYLSEMVREWQNFLRQSKNSTFGLHLNFSALARQIHEKLEKFPRIVKKPSPKEMGMISLDLQENYNFSDLTTEPFPFEFQNILSATILPPLKKMNLQLTHPEFEDFLSEAALAKRFSETLPARFFVREEATYPLAPTQPLPSFGLSEIALSLAKEHKKEIYYGISPQLSPNFLLYRTFLHPMDGYLFWADLEMLSSQPISSILKLRKELLEVSQLRSADKKKPVANLVLSANRSPLQLAQFVEPILNALLANGYELKITFGEISKGADLYYITNSNEWLKNLSFFEELLHLLDHKKSRFYGPVILHPMGEIQTTGRWKKIREHFKIPDSEVGWVRDLPEAVTVKGKRIPWRTTLKEKNEGMSFLRESQIKSYGGEVLLSEVFHNETFALIVKSGNHFLVNGNALHLKASYFLSQIVGGTIGTPIHAYLNISERGGAALALEESTLKVKLPYLQPEQKWQILRYLEGEKISEEFIQGAEFFETNLKPFELILLVPLLQ